MIERLLRGATVSEVALELGVHERTIQREVKHAPDDLVMRTRERMLDLLDKASPVYATILATPPEELHKHSKGYKLQMDVADKLNDGLGVFKREAVTTHKSVLETILTEQPAEPWGRADSGERLREARRVTFVPGDGQTIDVEALPAADPTPE